MNPTSTEATSEKRKLERVGILFAGGPAPAANAVISTAAVSFLRNGIEVIGFKNGYLHLVDYEAGRPLQAGRDYIQIDHAVLRRSRNTQGILIGTSRVNPGMQISSLAHLDDPDRVASLQRVYEGLASLGIDGLVSIGGDDTLKTANLFKLFQERLPAGKSRIPIVHLPKTIDNDYHGTDFTFGYFTAVDTLAREVRNLLYDAEAYNSYFIAETMGRSAGWLAYGAAIAGEASLVASIEDIGEKNLTTEVYEDPETGETRSRKVMVVENIVDGIVRAMLAREKEGKEFGVIVLAEGLAELLPLSERKGIPRDQYGHIVLSLLNLAHRFARLVAEAYERATGRKRKVRGVQLGFEARCAQPHAFDVILGSQLGVGAYRALAEEGLDGVMVSTHGQLELCYVPFSELIDPEKLVTFVRHIRLGSDFHRLARFLETYVNE